MIFLVSKNNPWSERLYSQLSKIVDCVWYTDGTYRSDLEVLKPSWVFFFHWSRIVPENIFDSHRCVVLHTGNLPADRGGSPIQNQILDGTIESRVSAIEMNAEVDSGGVYASLPITLQGSVDDIWMTISNRALLLIQECVEKSLKPTPQTGTPRVYKRNRNNTLPLTNAASTLEVHRFIQMLDSDHYPNAFIDIGDFRLEFSRSQLRNKELTADVKIRKLRNE